MYRSSTAPPAQADQERVASRIEHVSDALLALPTPVNTISDNLNLSILGPDDEGDKFGILSDDEAEAEVEMVGSVVATVEGDKEIPIDVEQLSDIADLEEAVVVKKEVQNEEELLEAEKCKRKKKRPIHVKARRSQRLKTLNK
ncbi:hypothetical protein ZWY2020_029816 [Hordeum vulgare]|nr:hypothetical protein ZWY2020_029816 [Hordeum vulgare]